MKKTFDNMTWCLPLLLLCVSMGAKAAIDPAELQILQRAGINVSDYDDWRFNNYAEDGHIRYVYLDNVGLTELPFVLLELPYVEVVDLYDNQISGDIGALAQAYSQTHPAISEKLRVLNINNNQLTGDIGPLAELLDDKGQEEYKELMPARTASGTSATSHRAKAFASGSQNRVAAT